MEKLRMWDSSRTWEEAESRWDQGAKLAEEARPNKGLNKLPKMVGITKKTARFLKWKALFWIVAKDRKRRLARLILKHPFRYLKGYIASLFCKEPFKREGDLFYYGVPSLERFEKMLTEPDTLFVLGFSYCHKPFECPSGRFSSSCIHDADHPVCRQCFIGKAIHALPEENTVALAIPTVHYIGEKMLQLEQAHPKKTVLFVITACEMTLKMFADWGNMAGIKGIGVRLDGRICNTMQAFDLSERGIKPGLTVVLDEAKQKILDLIRIRREASTRPEPRAQK